MSENYQDKKTKKIRSRRLFFRSQHEFSEGKTWWTEKWKLVSMQTNNRVKANDNDQLKTYKLERFQPIQSKLWKPGNRDGVAFYARKDLEFERLELKEKLECLIVKVMFKNLYSRKFCVVRPDAFKFSEFPEMIKELLDCFKSSETRLRFI